MCGELWPRLLHCPLSSGKLTSYRPWTSFIIWWTSRLFCISNTVWYVLGFLYLKPLNYQTLSRSTANFQPTNKNNNNNKNKNKNKNIYQDHVETILPPRMLRMRLREHISQHDPSSLASRCNIRPVLSRIAQGGECSTRSAPRREEERERTNEIRDAAPWREEKRERDKESRESRETAGPGSFSSEVELADANGRGRGRGRGSRPRKGVLDLSRSQIDGSSRAVYTKW